MNDTETAQLVESAGHYYCGYNDGSGDDGFPTFALIRVEGIWMAVCALHAKAAAEGEMERNWAPDGGSDV